MLVLVPCHDDAEVLRRSLPVMLTALRPGQDRLVVIADRCTDDTQDVARQMGADCLVRLNDSEGGGKGGALRFALANLVAGSPVEKVAVFDADSHPSPDFFSAAQRCLTAGQAEIVPAPSDALLSRLAAYSEIVSQKIVGRLRAALRWNIPLRGTGMVIERALLETALAECRTQVEDLELTLILSARRIRIEPLAASVADPKPEAGAGIAAQRARWLAGNLAALRVHFREVLKLCGSLSGITLVLWLFCKPKSLLFCAKLILFVLVVALAAGPWWLAVKALLGLLLAKDLGLLLGGLFVVDRPLFYLPAVLASPLYPLMWLRSAVRSPRAGRSWLSARRPG